MQADLDAAVRRQRIDDFLVRAGADALPHPGGTLRDHLHRTADRLATWDAPGWVVDAGRWRRRALAHPDAPHGVPWAGGPPAPEVRVDRR